MDVTVRRLLPPLVSLMLVSATAAGCATNPATGETQLSLISEEQEIEMGREAARQVEASIGLVDDPELQTYVADVGARLATDSERPDLPWSFKVVDDPAVNAFALPGGFVYVTRGIAGAFMSEGELAAVLGHEIGHVTARHSVKQMSQQQLYGGLAAIGAAALDLGPLAQGVLGTGLDLLFLRYSRDDERQADDLGLRYMTRAGYASGEMLDVFRTLERVEASSGSGTPNWLSTHPSPGDRLERITRRIQNDSISSSRGIVRRDRYLDRVDGLVYGTDPRNGFFRSDLFLHPTLRFQLHLPTGWTHQNLSQAVVSGSPGQDAAIELTLAPESTAEEALRTFRGESGVGVGDASRTSVNDLPTIVADFEAETQSGTLRGTAAFIELGGRVYRILGYAAESRFGDYEQTIRRTVGSFDRLSDPSALDVRPRRIKVVHTANPMSLEQFKDRYPTDISVQELSLINGVSANDRLDAGTWKTVIGEAP